MDAHTIAAEFRLSLGDVRRMYREFRQVARQACNATNDLRKRVWDHYTPTPESSKMWRSGMEWRFKKVFDGGDETQIPGFDLVAQELNQDVGELFDYLQRGFERLPTTDDTWNEVYDVLARYR
tara:strand:+ start:1416 stop:1784 length:369 start_codon:yes stop_codon:yes gene_type:complete